jgi:magnesium chelatase family protein
VIATDKSCALVLLVAMTRTEALETTKIYSALGLADGLVDTRPFRAPHPTISPAALIGGGSTPCLVLHVA